MFVFYDRGVVYNLFFKLIVMEFVGVGFFWIVFKNVVVDLFFGVFISKVVDG